VAKRNMVSAQQSGGRRIALFTGLAAEAKGW
jgi:hypothetical protein